MAYKRTISTSGLEEQLQQAVENFVAGILTVVDKMAPSDGAATPKARAAVGRSPAASPRAQRVQPRSVVNPPLPAVAPAGPAKRPRASAAEVKRYKDLAFATAKRMPPGFSKGELMKRTGGKIDMGRYLTLLVDEGLLTRQGDRRSTRYWVK